MHRTLALLLPSILISFACGGSDRSAYTLPAAAEYRASESGGEYVAGAGAVTTRAEHAAEPASSVESDEEDSGGGGGDMAYAAPARAPAVQAAPPPPAAPPSISTSGVPSDADTLIAQADRRQTTPAAQPRQAPDETRSATDATSGPLLIYQAILHLAVYQVQDNQRAVITIAREMNGFLAQQSDTVVVVRVPARRFQEALARVEALGDVLSRNIQATDVSEEFRDTQIRLRNLEQVRDRLAALLAQARTVEESLQIERELERLTTEIESMKGRLRFLEDRIAFSTITVNFSPKETENLQGELFNLPFNFLYNLGLRTLMNFR